MATGASSTDGITVCGRRFEPAPDEWDRSYAVDFFLRLPKGVVGLQIKPKTYQSSGYFGRWKGVVRNQHRRFRISFGGEVFILVRDAGEQDPRICVHACVRRSPASLEGRDVRPVLPEMPPSTFISGPSVTLLVLGPQEYIRENWNAVVEALRAKDLRPETYFHSSESMRELDNESVELVVTSPPYPLIEMWDDQLAAQTNIMRESFATTRGYDAGHDLLARVWEECHRLLVPGGILCVNIGDATRASEGDFRCFMNHVRTVEACEALGFHSLVPILWKKPTNKPNAFLGSGFYPPNAYVTLDCEFILIFRKGSKRTLPSRDPLRYASQYAKGERDVWFSQIWEIRGAPQDAEHTAPFPLEVPYRLVRMFSCLGDTVLDPFAGSGATLHVARALGRKAVGYEINEKLRPLIASRVPASPPSPEGILKALLTLYVRTNGQATKPGEALEMMSSPGLQAFA